MKELNGVVSFSGQPDCN